MLTRVSAFCFFGSPVRRFAGSIFCCCLAVSAQAASIDRGEFLSLAADAAASGAVPVVVSVASVSFKQLEADGASRKTIRQIEGRSNALFQELGSEALSEGRWENKVGQLGFLVTPKGLSILARTQNAASFWRGASRALDAHSATSGFRSLISKAAQDGTVKTSVRIRNEAADYEISRDGRISVRGGSEAITEHTLRSNRVLSTLPKAGVSTTDAAQAILAQSRSPSLTENILFLDLDKRSLMALAHNPDVTALDPVDYVDRSAPFLDPDALEQARLIGSAEILVFLRNPLPKLSLSVAEYKRMRATNSRALRSVLSDHGIDSGVTDISEFGVVASRLTYIELQRLWSTTDRRILGVELNKPIAQAALVTSTQEMNLRPWWDVDAPAFPNAGYKGSYPFTTGDPSSVPVPINVIVFDTGVQATHPLLANKVVFEACFGSNVDFVDGQGVVTQRYRSICPQQGPAGAPDAGDSPVTNIANSGGPSPNGIGCVLNTVANPTASDVCSHGTHVAGIAAGNDGDLRRGVAPGAKIVSVQVFSFDPQRNASPVAFTVDMFRGLQVAADAMLPVPVPVTNTSPRNNYVVNMSIGGTIFNTPCNNRLTPAPGSQLAGHPTLGAMMDAVAQLRDRGVPVIVSAGNNSSTTGLTFPACLPGVIKVGAMQNTLAGNIPTWYSNYPILANFPGEAFFLAPGGAAVQGLPGIESAWIAPGIQYNQISGTSQAAPHVAGLYAMVMGGFRKLDLAFTVDGATAFIQGNDGSFDATFNVAGTARTYRAVRLRNP